MRHFIIIAIFTLIFTPLGSVFAQNSPKIAQKEAGKDIIRQNTSGDIKALRIDINTALDPELFFNNLFNIFENNPLIQESAERITNRKSFDEADRVIGEKIGINPTEIIKSILRAILWILESGVAFFSHLVD